jgi:Fe2+ transport system protein FeoA
MNTAEQKQSLWALKKGQRCTLLGFDEAMDARYKERVFELGFRPKTEVMCLKTSAFGAPRVYQVNNSVFSLEDTVANHILVEPISDQAISEPVTPNK